MRTIPQFNFPAFDEATKALRGIGHDVFSPAEHDRETHGADFADLNEEGSEEAAAKTHGFDLRAALGADLAYIAQHADAVAVLEGWEASKGARAEVATALALGLIVLPWDFFYPARELLSTYDNDPGRITELPPIATDENEGKLLIDGEVRTTSSTGGEKGVKPARFDLLPAGPLWQVAELYGRGAEKYAARNWELGYEWSKSFGAMMRHAWLFWQGEDNDQETGKPHMASVVFHAFALMEFAETHPGFDDRPKSA